MPKQLAYRLLLGIVVSLCAGGPEAAAQTPNQKVASIEELIQKLQSKDYGTRLQAAGGLEELGRRARPAIPALVDALGDNGFFNGSNDDFVYWSAARTLIDIGPSAIPALTAAVKNHPNRRVRNLALCVLGKMGTEAQAALPDIQAALRNEELRPHAALALWQIDPDGRLAIAGLVPGTRPPLPTLIDCLQHNERKIRQTAANALYQMGPAAKDAIPALEKALKDEDANLLARVLERIRANKSTRSGAPVQGLGDHGDEAAPAVSALIAALKAPAVRERWAAADTLGRLGRAAKEAVPALRRALRDPERAVRASAAYALGQMGTEARPAVAALGELLRDPEPIVRWAALTALSNLGPVAAEAAPAVTELVRDQYDYFPVGEDNEPWEFAVRSARFVPQRGERIWNVDPSDRDRHPALSTCEKERPVTVPERAIRVLSALGPGAKQAVPALRAALNDGRPTVRRAAADALRRIAPETLAQAAPNAQERAALWADLAANDEATAFRAAWTLILFRDDLVAWLPKRLPPAPAVTEEHLARLIGELDHEQFGMRRKATRELLERAELAVPALNKALADKPPLEVRQRLELILQLIGKGTPSPDYVRALRAVAVLERMDIPAARHMLESLAAGAPGARLTQAARAALDRQQ